MIQIADLRFRYGNGGFQLRIDQLDLARGRSLAITGASGSGKTTLLNLLGGVSGFQSGRLEVCGQPLQKLSESQRREWRLQHVGLVFQGFELLRYLSVLENILLPLRFSRRIEVSAEKRERAKQLASELGIGDKVSRRIDRLSQGERQRVALCRALLLEPELLLCDEPTANLDPENKQQVMELLLDYVRRNKTTLVTATHDLELLQYFDESSDMGRLQSPSGATA